MNARKPSVSRPSFSVTSASFWQLLNAKSPTVFTEAGIVTEVSAVAAKAFSPMDVTVSGMMQL